MEFTQISFETSDLFEKSDMNISYSTIVEKDEFYFIKAMIFRQSSRVVYRSVLSFWDVRNICKHTPVKPDDDKQILLNLNNIKNRYLEPRHGKEITLYIRDNIEDFILPNLTTVIDTPFSVVYNINDEKSISADIFEKLKQNNGCICAWIKIPKDTMFTISDGNHRTYSIHELVNKQMCDTEIEGLYIGIDFFLEVDKEKEKQLFVALNTNKSIDSSVMSLLNENDMISDATKSLLGVKENYRYMVKAFYMDSDNYIGVDLVNDNVSRCNNAISFNMIKNLISMLAVDSLNGDKKFEELYSNDKIAYIKFMKKISTFLDYIFENCEPFTKIDKDLSNIKQLREKYISLTGAGLYVIAKIGHMGIKYDDIQMEKLAEALCRLEWRRDINGNANELFMGGILTIQGKISNNRTAINTTTEKIKQILKVTDEDIKCALSIKPKKSM